MSPLEPLVLLLPYLSGLAFGAALRSGYPGGAGTGFVVAVAAALGWWLAVPWRGPLGLRRRPAIPSWYEPPLGPSGGSFWQPPPWRRVLRQVLLAGSLWLVGVGWMWLSLGPPPPGLEALSRLFVPAPGGKKVFVRGVVAGEPERLPRGWRVLLRPDPPAGRCGLLQLTLEAAGSGSVATLPAGLRRGARLAFAGRLYRPVAANPGETPFTGISPWGRVSALGWVPVEAVRVEQAASATPWAAGVDRVRSAMAGFLASGASPPGRGILLALLLGDRSELTDEVNEDFGRAGAMHLLVVSGLHLSVLAAMLADLGARLKLGRRGQAVWTAVGVLAYAALTGWHPPVTRAALMALSALGARWVGRRQDSERALWVSVLAMLAQRPLLFFDAGFRLTVAATWGVVVVGPLLNEGLRLTDPTGRGWGTALGAQAAAAPLTLLYFGRAPVVALAASPILIGLGSLLVEAGVAAGALGLAWPFLGPPVAAGLGAAANLLWVTAKAVGRIPWATVNLPGPPEWLVALYFVGLGQGRRAWWTRGAGWAALLAAAVGAVWVVVIAGLSPWLQCTFLSVGEGDALHLRLPGGALGPHLMVDAGSSAYRPLSYLRRAGVQSLAAVVVTHPHRDHAGGVRGLILGLPLGRLITGVGGAVEAATGTGVRMAVSGGAGLEGGNEESRRVIVRYENFCLLDSGDAPLTATDPALARLPRRFTAAGRALVLVIKVPHHGARGALTPDFLAAWRPDLAVISVGPNGYGHPAPEVLGLLRDQRIPVLRTDLEGAVLLQTDGHRVRWRTFRGSTGGSAARRSVRCPGVGPRSNRQPGPLPRR